MIQAPSVKITKEILRDNLGFEISDLGDYWECSKGDFVLMQPKFQIMPGTEMPFIFGFKTTVSKSISFEHVHHLQNFYRQIEQKELIWKVPQQTL